MPSSRLEPLLLIAVALLGLTVLFGGALAVMALKRPGKKPSWLLATVHGAAAIAGYGALLLALEGPPRGTALGTQSFGLAAAILLLIAAALGLATLLLHLRRAHLPGFWAGAHASVAITGYVILAVYLLAG